MKARSRILSPSVACGIAVMCAVFFSAHTAHAGSNVWTSHDGPGVESVRLLAIDPTTPNTITEGASLADWERRIAAAPAAEQAAVRRRFAAVRPRLMRDERVPQVLRLSMSGEAFRAACAAEEARGAGLGVEIWQATGAQVIAAVPPASRRRLARAGVASEVLFESVADWQRAHRAGMSAARSIEPYYQSAAAARDLVPVVIVFDLSQDPFGAADAARGLLDHESVLGRNASYLAYLETVPASRMPLEVSQRYAKRGLTVAGVFPLAEFPKVAGRFFPELDIPSGGAAAATATPPFDGAFHTYEEVEAELRDLATRYPTIAKLISLGPDVRRPRDLGAEGESRRRHR